MSADSYEELELRLEDLIATIKSIRYDSWGCETFEQLRYLIDEAKEELEKL